jgi:hypothetical protein
MTQKNTRNCRRSLRKTPHAAVTVECHVPATGHAHNVAAQFLDISEGGVKLAVTKKLACNDVVDVTFNTFAQPRPIKRRAIVCWIQPMENDLFCVGLQFDKPLLFAEVLNISSPKMSFSLSSPAPTR